MLHRRAGLLQERPGAGACGRGPVIAAPPARVTGIVGHAQPGGFLPEGRLTDNNATQEESMKNRIAAVMCLALAGAPFAFAQGNAAGNQGGATAAAAKATTKNAPTEKQKRHQARMRDCSARASADSLKGDARKKFMSTCLKG
jgi:hypothetical protein